VHTVNRGSTKAMLKPREKNDNAGLHTPREAHSERPTSRGEQSAGTVNSRGEQNQLLEPRNRKKMLDPNGRFAREDIRRHQIGAPPRLLHQCNKETAMILGRSSTMAGGGVSGGT
jgi:hypothetical protein